MRSVRYNLKENYGLSWYGNISNSNAKRRVLSIQKININSQILVDLHAKLQTSQHLFVTEYKRITEKGGEHTLD